MINILVNKFPTRNKFALLGGCVDGSVHASPMEGDRGLPTGIVRGEDGMFVPEDQSQNWCRHFGVKRDKTLYLCEDEVLYLRDREPREEYSVRTKAYFFIKNNCYNLLSAEGGELLLYKKHKHFNRKKDKPVCVMRYVSMDERGEGFGKGKEDEALCVMSDSLFTFLRVRRVGGLSLSTPNKLRK